MKGVLFLGNRSLKLEDFPSIQKLARGREALPAQTARVLPGTQNQAPPDLAANALDPAVAQPLVRLARRSNRRDAADLHRLAPPRLRFYWRRKCQAGRPPIPLELQAHICSVAGSTPTAAVK